MVDSEKMFFRMALGGQQGKRLFLKTWLSLTMDGEIEKARWLYEKFVKGWSDKQDKEDMEDILAEIIAALATEIE